MSLIHLLTVIRKCKEEGARTRELCRKKNRNKLDFLVNKYGKHECGLDDLNEEDQEIYWNASVLKGWNEVK